MPLSSRKHRINERIRVREVRVIDENGEQMGVLLTEDALRLAEERGLDLVEVAANAHPPVTRILDYGRFKYEQAKRENEGRKKQKNVLLREVKMRPNIGTHDKEFKTRTAAKLLREGDKVKITIRFRGREITHPELGRERIREMMDALEADGIPLLVERPVGMEGRTMFAIVAPDKVRAAALSKEQEHADQDGPADSPAEGADTHTANAAAPSGAPSGTASADTAPTGTATAPTGTATAETEQAAS